MTMLDDLQRKAEAATPGRWIDGRDGYVWTADFGRRVALPMVASVGDAAYIASASPDQVLRLIAVARAAQTYVDGMASEATLRESLAALEGLGNQEGRDRK